MPTYVSQEGYVDHNSEIGYKSKNAYTGCDVIAVFTFPEIIDAKPIVFGELSTISYSFYRDKFPIRAIGYSRAKGYTGGSRTVAGSLIFKLIDYSAINRFAHTLYKNLGNISLMPDELPPFNCDITFVNEYGETTNQSIIGIEIAEGNQIISADELTISEQFSFVAQDIKQIDNKFQWDRDIDG